MFILFLGSHTGIVNPVCSANFDDGSSTAETYKQDAPDLMSFTDEVSKDSTDLSTSDSEQTKRAHTSAAHSAYNATVKNVLSMFDTTGNRAHQYVHFPQQTVHWSNAPGSFYQLQPQGLPLYNPDQVKTNSAISGFQSGSGIVSSSMQCNLQSSGNNFNRSNSPVLYHLSATNLVQPQGGAHFQNISIPKNHSHPDYLNTFGKQRTALSEGHINGSGWKADANNGHTPQPQLAPEVGLEVAGMPLFHSRTGTLVISLFCVLYYDL